MEDISKKKSLWVCAGCRNLLVLRKFRRHQLLSISVSTFVWEMTSAWKGRHLSYPSTNKEYNRQTELEDFWQSTFKTASHLLLNSDPGSPQTYKCFLWNLMEKRRIWLSHIIYRQLTWKVGEETRMVPSTKHTVLMYIWHVVKTVISFTYSNSKLRSR